MFQKFLFVCTAAFAMSFVDAKRCCCEHHNTQAAPVVQEAPPAQPKKPVCTQDHSHECGEQTEQSVDSHQH